MIIEAAGSFLGVAGALLLIHPSLKVKAIACLTWLISNMCLIYVAIGDGRNYMASMFLLYSFTNLATIMVTIRAIRKIRESCIAAAEGDSITFRGNTTPSSE